MRVAGFRSPISPRLALHQNELDIILDYRVRFVGLSQETAAPVFYFMSSICDLVSDILVAKLSNPILRQLS